MLRHPCFLLISVFLLIIAFRAQSQFPISPNARDENNLKTGYWTILYDSANKVVTNFDSVVYYRIIRFEKGKPTGKVRDFFRTYIRQWDGYLASSDPDIKEGEANYYYENGKLQYHCFYKNNLLEGPFQQYYDNGPIMGEGLMKNDTSEGQWTFYFPSGVKSIVCQRVKGIDNGDFEDYFKGGQLSAKGKKVNGEKSGFWVEYHANGQLAMHENYVSGKLNGPYKFWNTSGIVESDGFFKDGEKSGQWHEYYPTGEKESEGEYINGKKTGWWRIYYTNGKLKTEGNQVDGNQQGPYVFYYEDGSVSGKGNLVNSLYNGRWIFTHQDGRIKMEADYLRDSINGYCIYYHDNGLKKSEGSYIMNKKDGLWKYYDINVVLSGTEIYSKNVLQGDNFDYYPNGQLKHKRYYVDGLREGEDLEYFQDGKPSATGAYKNDQMVGAWKWYHPNGQLESSYFYVDGFYEGPWINYYADGKVQSVGQGVHGKRNGLTKYYYHTGLLEKEGYSLMGKDEGRWVNYDSITGKKVSDGKYVNHKLDGKWKFYYPNGKLESTTYYKNGFNESRANIVDSLDRLIELGEYDLALKEVEWLKRVIKRDYPKNSKFIISPLYYYATISLYKNDNVNSLMWFEKYRDTIVRLQGDTVKNYQVALNGIALNKMNLGQKDEALALYDKLIQMSSRSDADYAIGISNKAFGLYKANRAKEAEDLLQSEWSIQRKESGDTSRQAMDMQWMLGKYYISWSDEYEKALPVLKNYYQLLSNHSKRSDPRFISCMKQIGTCYKSQQKRTEAIKWFTQELALADSLHQNTTLPYLEDFRTLIGLYSDINKYDTALILTNRLSDVIASTKRIGSFIDARMLEGRATIEYYLGDYPKAIADWKQAVSLFEKLGETNTTYYTGALQGIGSSINYSGSNTFAEAEPYFLKAQETTLKNSGERSVQYHRLLANTGNFYRSSKQFFKADSVLKKSEYLTAKYFGKENEWYAECAREIGLLEMDQANYEKAAEWFQNSLTYYRPNRANDPLACTSVLTSLAKTYRWWEKYEESEKIIREAISIFENEIGGIGQDYIDARSQLANLLFDRELYSESEKVYLSILSQQAKFTGEQSYEYGYRLEDMGYFYNGIGDYKKAEKYYAMYSDIALKEKGRNSFSYMDSNFKLANVYDNLGLKTKADEFYKKAIALSVKIYGDQSLQYAQKQKSYGKFCERQGWNAEAAKSFTIASNIAKQVYGEDNLSYSFFLIDQARGYLNSGRYAEAEALLLKSKDITSHHLIDALDDYRTSLELFATFYEDMGRYEEAEKLHEEVLSIIEKSDGRHVYYARRLMESAGNDYGASKNSKAIPKLEEALKILEEEVDPGHWAILDAHNLLGLISQDEGKLDESENHFNYSIDQRVLSKLEISFDQAITLHNKASVLTEKGKFAEAEKLQKQSASTFRSLDTKMDLDLEAGLQDNVAILYQAWGKYDLAEKNWLEVLQKYSTYIQRNFSFMSDYEKAKFWQKNKKDFENFNTFAILRKDRKPEISSTMYNNQLATKGILLSASNKVRKRIYESRDSTQISMYYDWVQNRERLAKEYAEATSDKKTPQVDSLERKVNLLEKELSLSTEDIRADKPTIWKDVQRTLGPDEAAIEIVRFHYFNRHRTDSVIYAALVLTAETKLYPQVAVLKNGDFLEKRAYKFYRNAIISQIDDTSSYAHFWAAIEPLVKNKKRLFISPDGVYNQINLKTLKNTSGRYLMENQDFIIVSNTRDLIAIKGRKKLRLMQTASLIGNPQFFVGQNDIPKEGTARDYSQEDRSGIAALPGTKQEIEAVEGLLVRKGWKVNSLVQTNAAEKQVKELPSSRIVHVATHGFFQDEKNVSWSTQDPMLRSGILLSGAANFMQNKQETDGENGILTAYEAANLSLEGTEMVVLSACETARGEIQQGEGVYGLQRAFITAGAESLVMSLWKVDDEATQKLMSLFYENWMKGMDKNEALNQAQRELRKTYPHPYYWGAFVMMRG